MKITPDITAAIGNTPLIKLRRASEQTGCTILAKAEFMNPGGSIKDRTARFIIDDAERKGQLKPGGVIVEGTAGNTGIGLAVVGMARGYRTVIVITDNQSQEKKDAIRILGADLHEVPPAPAASENHFVKVSQRLAQELANTEPAGAIWANQFDNTANRDGHARTTAQEVWTQTGGSIDAFICAIGTGGTLAGMSDGLKAHNKNVIAAVADPMGAAMYSYVKTGELKSEGTSITEGIGQGRVTKNVEGAVLDDAFQVTDTEALDVIFDLVKYEGLCVGGSSGINVAGAIKLAHALGPGKTIVTVLCDHGSRYQSKLFNPKFLRERGLPVPDWIEDPAP
ncbi:MAG: cysteine synthase A [Rhodobacteraceae bacterium]|nr:cysteine synthase A [Paracoccaceae bacterium]